MKFILKFFENIRPQIQEGKKFYFLKSTVEAFETFFFVPNKTTRYGSHIRDYVDTKRYMFTVIIALIPPLLWGMFNVGYQYYNALGKDVSFLHMFFFGFTKVMPLIIVSYVSGLAIEFAFAQIRKHEVNEGFLVTGLLIPLILPVTTPLWIVSLATIFSIILCKEVYGGTGMNIFNPALIARAFIFFAYPSVITGDKVWIYGLKENIQKNIDSITSATPLANCALYKLQEIPDNLSLFFGLIPGSIGETSKLAILIGALILIYTNVANYRIIISVIIGGITASLLFNIINANPYMQISPLTHLLMGSFLFGAVYMATDPVTSAQTKTGKIIYGFLIGFFTILIRVANPAYPEGTMLSILLMNAFAPLIDYIVVHYHVKKREKRYFLLNNKNL